MKSQETINNAPESDPELGDKRQCYSDAINCTSITKRNSKHKIRFTHRSISTSLFKLFKSLRQIRANDSGP